MPQVGLFSQLCPRGIEAIEGARGCQPYGVGLRFSVLSPCPLHKTPKPTKNKYESGSGGDSRWKIDAGSELFEN